MVAQFGIISNFKIMMPDANVLITCDSSPGLGRTRNSSAA